MVRSLQKRLKYACVRKGLKELTHNNTKQCSMTKVLKLYKAICPSRRRRPTIVSKSGVRPATSGGIYPRILNTLKESITNTWDPKHASSAAQSLGPRCADTPDPKNAVLLEMESPKPSSK